ncbi:hypothetical protein [Gordonia phthalatica]|uniref:Pyrrolo-quinoline quinone n=1 Tax=Gordonia phthalatica TaxID=1136941 RepID=A0A0N9N9I9_9ACTN|nr:hypothetical protein [Gordonia phthalatica]ALG83654.1 hypothetical protein ACH46_02980 [Gordonia phthalatica]
MTDRMSLRALLDRLHLGMPAVAAAGSIALLVTAGVVLSGTPTVDGDPSAQGVLQNYAAEPAESWTLDDTVLPGAGGQGAVTVAATAGNDWLISYPVGFKREFMLVDSRSGRPQWDAPVDAGFGSCGITARGQIGCAIRLQIDGPKNGFYLVDRSSGIPTRAADSDDTSTVIGLGPNFVHVNQSGYQVSLRTPSGTTMWSRTFAGAAKVSAAHDALVVATSDGASFVVDPVDGDDLVSCSQCTIDTFSTGIAAARTAPGSESVTFYPATDTGVSGTPSGTAERSRLVRGPSTYPVIAPAGEGSALEAAGRYEIVDPATGEALWQIGDPNLSKSNARPCGAVFSVARKDRSRVFFDLIDGARRGSMPPPALDDPDAGLDVSTCVGASNEMAVFANPNQLTAYSIDAGTQLWSRPISGTAEIVDGRIVLRQGSTLTVLRPN